MKIMQKALCWNTINSFSQMMGRSAFVNYPACTIILPQANTVNISTRFSLELEKVQQTWPRRPKAQKKSYLRKINWYPFTKYSGGRLNSKMQESFRKIKKLHEEEKMTWTTYEVGQWPSLQNSSPNLRS